MNENDVVAISQLLGRSKEEISAALENGGVQTFVDDFKTSHTVMPKTDFDKFKTNYRQTVIDELVQNKHDLPQQVYEYVKGSVLERKEKDLAKSFNIREYSGFNDLVEKIVESSKQKPDDDEIKRLKARITDVEKEKESAVKDVLEKSDKRFIGVELTKLAESVGIDADGEALDIQKEVLLTMFTKKFNLKVENDRIVAYDNNQPVVDSKLDPRPIGDLIKEYAPKVVKLKSPEGGRGDTSTTTAIGREINFEEYCKANRIEPNSYAQAQAFKELSAKGHKLI